MSHGVRLRCGLVVEPLRVSLLQHLEQVRHFRTVKAVFIGPAEEAVVRGSTFFIEANGIWCFSEAAGVHPFLTGPLTLKHLLLGPAIAGVVRFPTHTVQLILTNLVAIVALMHNCIEERILCSALVLGVHKVFTFLVPVDVFVCIYPVVLR